MQFVYEGLSYHLDTNSVLKELELIYLKALQRDNYQALTDDQKLLMDVAWKYFSAEFLKHNHSNGHDEKGRELYEMIKLGYVEKLTIDGERGEMTVELSHPVVVN